MRKAIKSYCRFRPVRNARWALAVWVYATLIVMGGFRAPVPVESSVAEDERSANLPPLPIERLVSANPNGASR
jgi:hypothetical protein